MRLKLTGARGSFRATWKEMWRRAWARHSAQHVTEAPAPPREMDGESDSPWLGAIPAGLSFSLFAWFVKPVPASLLVVLWSLLVGALMGAAVYSLTRAHPYLLESWRQREQERLIPRKTSFWLDDYEEAGQSWVVRFWKFAGLAGAVWLAGFI